MNHVVLLIAPRGCRAVTMMTSQARSTCEQDRAECFSHSYLWLQVARCVPDTIPPVEILHPRNPAFQKAVRDVFAAQEFMRLIGAELGRVEPGEVEISLRRSAALMQQSGTIHAGVLAAIADTACGLAALTLMPEASNVLSVEFKLNLLAPAAGETVSAAGHVIRAGGTLTVCSADIRDEEGKMIATMLGTMIRRPLR